MFPSRRKALESIPSTTKRLKQGFLSSYDRLLKLWWELFFNTEVLHGECCNTVSLPSQVCLIGKSRTYLPSAEVWMDEQRTRYLHSRQGHPQSSPAEGHAPSIPQVAVHDADHQDSHRTFDLEPEGMPDGRAAEGGAAPAPGLWMPGFCPREKAERVRNCAALPRDFIDQVVLQVANLLLDGKKLNTGSSEDGSPKTWNGGGRPHPPGQADWPAWTVGLCSSAYPEAGSEQLSTVAVQGEEGGGQGCWYSILRNDATREQVIECQKPHFLKCKFNTFILCNP